MCNLLITDNYSLFILNVVASAQWILYQLPFTTIENGAFTIILHKGYTSMGFYAFQKKKKKKNMGFYEESWWKCEWKSF